MYHRSQNIKIIIFKLYVEKSNLAIVMVNHDIVWFDISVHDAHAVAVFKRLQIDKKS